MRCTMRSFGLVGVGGVSARLTVVAFVWYCWSTVAGEKLNVPVVTL